MKLDNYYMSSEFIFYIIISIFIGFVVILFGIYLTIKSNNTKKWKETTGVVIKSVLEKISTIAGDGGASQSYKAAIEYKYCVGNQEYISKRVFYGDPIGKPLPFKSKLLIKKYPEGSNVIVYYNPFKPKESVLQKGIKFIIIELYILGGFFILLGFAILKYENTIKSFIIN